MLWNWNTIDACTSILYIHLHRPSPRKTDKLIDSIGFISKSWRITSHGMFAGSCIGVILLVMALEFLRRLSKEYDRYILQQFKRSIITLGESQMSQKSTSKLASTTTPDSADEHNPIPCPANPTNAATISTIPFRPSLIQQSIRALLHMITFAIAYFVMLLAMYYNGYFIICIFIGAYLGAFVFTWESVGVSMGYVSSSHSIERCMYGVLE